MSGMLVVKNCQENFFLYPSPDRVWKVLWILIKSEPDTAVFGQKKHCSGRLCVGNVDMGIQKLRKVQQYQMLISNPFKYD